MISPIFSHKAFTVYILIILTSLLIGCADNTIVDSGENAQQKQYKGYTWMTIALPWDGSFNMPFFSGDTYEKESTQPAINLTPSTAYTIYVALGSTDKRIYNVVAIRSDGKAIAAYKDPQSYRTYQKKFELTPVEISTFTKLLIKNHAGKLPASIIDPEAKGGVQGGLTLISHKTIRRSFFSNSWSNSFKNITEYINDKLLRYSPKDKNNGFVEVRKSILSEDPEATFAIRGLIDGK